MQKTHKILVDSGADVNAKDRVGRTPLYYASRRGFFEGPCFPDLDPSLKSYYRNERESRKFDETIAVLESHGAKE